MSQRLKRNESSTEGLQRVVSQELPRNLLQVMGRKRLMPAQLHDARKTIKNLRAMLRLTRGALSDEARMGRNQALRNLAGPLSGPRDAAVTLAAFENAYKEGLNGNPHPKAEPSWATQLHQSLSEKAHALDVLVLGNVTGALEFSNRDELLARSTLRTGISRNNPGGKLSWVARLRLNHEIGK